MFIFAKSIKGNVILSFFVLVLSMNLMGLSVASAANEARILQGGEGPTSRSLMISLNKAVIIELPSAAADVLVSNQEIVDAVIRTPKRVYLLGSAVGQTNVFFFDNRGRQILNLEIQVEQDLNALSNLYKKLLPDTRVELNAFNNNIVLSGAVDSASEAKSVVEIAERFVGDGEVLNMMTIRERGQVMLKVRIVEMQRRLIKQLGITVDGVARISDAALDFATSSSTSFGGGLGVNSSINNPFDNVTNLDSRFDIFERNGLVRTLAEPNLTAVSGQEAEFLAGGRFPIPVTDATGAVAVNFENFGVELKFVPVVLSKNRISLQLETAVSELSNAAAATVGGSQTVDPNTGDIITTSAFSIPSVTERKAKTTVEIPSGGSMAIAGLLQDSIQSSVEGVPGLKDVAVLGQLFRSNEFQRDETELIIVITPYLVEPTSGDKLKTPGDTFAPASSLQSALLGNLEARYGRKSKGNTKRTVQGPVGFILD